MAHRNPDVKSFLLGSSMVLSEMASLSCMAFREERSGAGEGLTLAAGVQSEVPKPSPSRPLQTLRGKSVDSIPLSFPLGQRLWLSGGQDVRSPFLPPAFPVSTMQPVSLALT